MQGALVPPLAQELRSSTQQDPVLEGKKGAGEGRLRKGKKKKEKEKMKKESRKDTTGPTGLRKREEREAGFGSWEN